jgi:undecaprenyl-diphosphatase
LEALDGELFLLINRSFSGPVAAAFFSAVTYLGDGVVLAALVLPALFLRGRVTFREHALPLVLTVAFSGIVVNVAKIAADRDRPPAHFAAQGVEVSTPLGTPRDRSFPSGHTQTAFATAVYLCFLFPRLAPVFLALAALVGLSRIAIGVHFPLDVLVGGATGSLISWGGFALNRRRLAGRDARAAEG